jgi:hypothetical protein
LTGPRILIAFAVMSGTITLTNKTSTILVLNLPHGLVPEAAKMSVVGVHAHDQKSGERKLSLAKKGPVSGSVTLLAGASAEVPRSALRAPDVQSALNAKRITITAPTPTAPTPDAPVGKKAAPAAQKG